MRNQLLISLRTVYKCWFIFLSLLSTYYLALNSGLRGISVRIFLSVSIRNYETSWICRLILGGKVLAIISSNILLSPFSFSSLLGLICICWCAWWYMWRNWSIFNFTGSLFCLLISTIKLSSEFFILLYFSANSGISIFVHLYNFCYFINIQYVMRCHFHLLFCSSDMIFFILWHISLLKVFV